jgi:alpha-tubulin suppressor-like RCC1 family protein
VTRAGLASLLATSSLAKRPGARIAWFLFAASLAVLVSCRDSPPLREPLVARVALAADAGAPREMAEGGVSSRSAGPAYEIMIPLGLCVKVDGRVHCRNEIVPDSPLVREAPTAGGPTERPVRKIAFGRDFLCVLDVEGAVSCAGGNERGQLGAGLRDERHELPVRLPALQGSLDVSAGAQTACVIRSDRRVACWGRNDAGESGSSTNYLGPARELVAPELVRDLSNVASVAMGSDSTCAVTLDHDVYCWGRSRTTEQAALRGETNEIPTRIDALRGTMSLTASQSAFCGIKDEDVVCFGDTSLLAVTEPVLAQRPNVVKLGIQRARQVALGMNHGCAVDADGAVFCFGNDSEGALGVPGKQSWETHPPRKVAGLPRAVAVACSTSISCALTASSEVYCWGRFSWTENESHDTPTQVKIAD